MTSQTPPTPRALLSAPSGRLAELVEHCARLRCIDRLVSDYLSAPLNLHCRVANLRGDQLVLHTESPVWHSMLRYHAPGMLAHLRARPELRALRDVRVKTVPGAGPEPAARPHRHLTPETAALITDLAASIADPELRRALRRLGRFPAR